MSMGPTHIFLFGFGTTDKLKGEAVNELFRLRTRGLVRMTDAMFARKEPNGEIRGFETEGLTAAEKAGPELPCVG